MQQNVEALSHGNILIAVLVLLVAVWMGSMVMDFVIKVRTLRKPQEKEAEDLALHQATCDKKFARDKERLDGLEGRASNLEAGQRVLCKGVYEILGHMLHNGNKDAMEQASRDIFDYLNS